MSTRNNPFKTKGASASASSSPAPRQRGRGGARAPSSSSSSSAPSSTVKRRGRGKASATTYSASSPSAMAPFKPPRKPVKAMELMREACPPYNWSRSTWKLLIGEQMLLDPKQDAASDDERVVYKDELNRTVAGLVYVSTFQLRFYPERHVKIPASFFRVPLATIARIEVPEEDNNNNTAATSSQIHLFCKDGRTLRFVAPLSKCLRIRDILVAYAFPAKLKYSFPFSVEENLKKLLKNGQNADEVARVMRFRAMGPRYSFHEEFERCGALPPFGGPRGKHGPAGAETPWRVSHVNQTYEFSPTYPALNIMPAAFTDAEVRSIGKFRSKCRIPSMSWSMPGTNGRGPTMWRCSQPKVGMQSKRNKFDESLLRWIGKSNTEHAQLMKTRQAKAGSKPTKVAPCLILGDCRPQVTAYANKVAGGGYEEEAIYDFLELRFLGIDNIHKVRGALSKLTDLIMAGKSSDAELTHWFKTVEETKWLYLLRVLLLGTIRTAHDMLKNRRSVVVHCSDGWDRTSQLCALVQLLLDPYARTIDGFCILVQKDWLSFGHQFQRRYGHGNAEHDDTQRSPIFIQFLDAVWQFLNQYPEFFEFNSEFLVLLADELYSCRFGTFLCDTEAERKLKYSLDRNTLSIWDHVEEHRALFRNPRYVADDSPLLPNGVSCLKNVSIWTDYHMRWGAQPSVPSWTIFETKRSAPPFKWPSNELVAVAHAKRATAAAILEKTEPLQTETRALREEVQRLRAQLRQLQGRTHMDELLKSPRHEAQSADDQPSEDMFLDGKSASPPTIDVVSVSSGEPDSADAVTAVADTSVQADDGTSQASATEDWAALAAGGGAYVDLEEAAGTVLENAGSESTLDETRGSAAMEEVGTPDDPLGDLHSASDDDAAEVEDDGDTDSVYMDVVAVEEDEELDGTDRDDDGDDSSGVEVIMVSDSEDVDD